MARSLEDRFARGFSRLVGWLLVLAALGAWALQGYIWAKEGKWLPFTFATFFQPESTGWLGIDGVIAWAIDTNCGVVLMLFGALFLFVAQAE